MLATLHLAGIDSSTTLCALVIQTRVPSLAPSQDCSVAGDRNEMMCADLELLLRAICLRQCAVQRWEKWQGEIKGAYTVKHTQEICRCC